jgi:hypothetical protein
MELFLDRLIVFIIWTSMGVIVGAVSGVTIGQIIKKVKSVTRVFVLIFGGIGLIIGLVSFSAFMDLGNSGPSYVDFPMLDFVIGITLSLIGSIPIYYLWFRKVQK